MWAECRMAPGADLAPVYRAAQQAGALSVHHFNYEDWYPDGAVVRLNLRPSTGTAAIKRIIDAEGVETHYAWDEEPDVEFFGNQWPLVRDFFAATGRLAAEGVDEKTLLKITHCHLNAHGLDVDDEFRWALRFAWNRLKMCWRDRRRLRGRTR